MAMMVLMVVIMVMMAMMVVMVMLGMMVVMVQVCGARCLRVNSAATTRRAPARRPRTGETRVSRGEGGASWGWKQPGGTEGWSALPAW